jgi:anti-sigma factor RsiW
MMTAVNESDLHAYVDGLLPPARRAEIEAWLARHPEAALRVSQWRQQGDALHRALDPILTEAVPAQALPEALQRRATPARAGRRPWLAVAASVASLAVGGAAGWIGHAQMSATAPMERFAQQALATHAVFAPDARHPIEVTADQEAHLVAWLSKRLGAPLRAPDLQPQGFRLIGGRLAVAEGGPSAVLMYEAADGTRITLQLRRMAAGAPDTTFRMERMPAKTAQANPLANPQAKKMMAFYWVDQTVGFAVTGPLDQGRLLELAQAVYHQYQQG